VIGRWSRLSRREFVWAAAGTTLGGVPAVARRRRQRRGGVIKHIGLDPPSFDIHGTVSYETQLASSFVHRTLFKFVQGARSGPLDFTLAPDLALRADVSTDGKTCTIALRPDVRWESRAPLYGRELTAADVKYSLDRAIKKSGYASLLGAIDGVETPDRHTVRIHLRDRYAPFVHNLAEPWNAILPREVEDKFGDFKSADSMIGCGPFVLERYEAGVKAVFARNPTYYERGLPYVDRVEWIFLQDRATQLSLFRAGQIDVPFYDGRIPRSDVASLKESNPTYPVVSWDWLAVRTLAMRTDRAPLNDVRVRRALSLAIDRRNWVARYVEGQGYADHGPVPEPMRRWKLPAKDGSGAASWGEYNPTLARQLLAEAGFPTGMKLRCTSWAGYGAEYVEELDWLAASLKGIGVELSIVNEDYGHYIRGSFLGKFDELSWGPSSLFTEIDGYLYNFFKSGEPSNRSHVSDVKLDIMLDAQRRAASRSSRKQAIDDIQRYTADRVFYIYTPYPKQVSSWNARLRNYAPKNSLDKGAQLEVVWLDA